METQEKLKPDNFPYVIATVAVVSTIIAAVILNSYLGEEIRNTTFGIVWAAITVVQLIFWLKTKNPGHFTFSIFGFAMSFSYISGYKGIYFIIPSIILISIHFYFIASKQLKGHYRNILELAALPVNEAKDGFTPRPMQAGTLNFNKEKFFKFGRFLSRNLIAFPVKHSGSYFLLIRTSRGFWFQNPDIRKDSYIGFDEEGNVSVNISKYDYQKFKEELTFDQLCVSLAGMFIEFWELFENGKQKEIISRLDSEKTSTMEGAV